QTVTNTIQDELATLNGRVSSIETDLENAPASAGAETDPELAGEIEVLRQQVQDLAARPAQTVTEADPGASEAIAALEAQLTELRAKAEADAARLAEAEKRLSTLATTTSDAAAATDSAAQLPLIFSG